MAPRLHYLEVRRKIKQVSPELKDIHRVGSRRAPRAGEREVLMKNVTRCIFSITLVAVWSFAVYAESASGEACDSGLVSELNQDLRTEAVGLKEFLDTRKQSRLSGRDRVEACSRWSVMNSYAKSMAKHFENAPSSDSAATMVDHLRSDLEGNTDCWTNANPQLASMVEGVRIVISRATRLGSLLSLPPSERKEISREFSSER